MKVLLGFVVLCVVFWTGSVMAEGEGATDQAQVQAPKAEASPGVKKARGNRSREKETEGTEAPNRFEADTVIKSQYKLNGEPLEVDPD